ncbi:MAG: universal stress protein, partial [Candidatus Thorarchaeota archaeon]
VLCNSKRIVLAVDGSEGAARAASVAFELAILTKSELIIVHVVPTPLISQISLMSSSNPRELLQHYMENGQRLLNGYLLAARERGIPAEAVLEKGNPSDRLVRLAHDREADLIVIGYSASVRGRRTSIGSVAERVVMSSTCTVIVAK